MKKKTKATFQKLTTLMIIALLLWNVGRMYVNLHENIHWRIFSRYDIKSNISVNPFTLEGTTTPTSYEYCNDFCKLSHTLNDVIGYNLVVIMSFIIVLMLAIYLIRRWEKKFV